MKKTLSLILCLTMILTFMPTGSVWASDEVSETEYISKTIDITSPKIGKNFYNDTNSTVFCRPAFAKAGDEINLGWGYLYSSSNHIIIDLEDMRDTTKFNWKDTTWASPKNTLTWNGIDYLMNVESATTGSGALDLSGWNYVQYDIEEGHYDKISLLANGTTTTTDKGIGVLLTYTDGSEFKSTDPVYIGNQSVIKSNAQLWKGFEVGAVSAVYYTTSEKKAVTKISADTASNCINVYDVKVDSAKTLKSVMLFGGNVKASVSEDGSYTLEQDTADEYAGSNVFAITAVTTQDLIDKYAPISKTIDISSYSNKISMANLGDANIKANYNSLALGNQEDKYLIDIDSIKSSPIWKEAWTDSMTSNTATFNGIDYKIPVVSANNGGKAGFETGDSNITLSIESGYYTDIKLLANSWNGVGVYTNYEKQLPIGIILNYADGTQEYKTTENIYGPFKASENALSFTTIVLNGSLWGTSTLTASSKDTKNAYMHLYEVSVDSEKELKSITVLSKNKKATQDGNSVTIEDGSGTHSQAAIFAITAVTNQMTIDNGAVLEEEAAKANALSELKELVSEISVDSLDYNSYTTIEGLNKAIEKCEGYGISIDSETQSKITAIKAKWGSFVSVPFAMTNNLNIMAYADYNSSFEVNYNHLGMWTSKAISLKDMQKLSYDGDVLTFKGLKYNMPVKQSPEAVARNNGVAQDYNYSVTPGYYKAVKIMANGYRGKNAPNAQYAATTTQAGALFKLIYDDGSYEYKETDTIHYCTDGSIKTASYWNGIEVPAVSLTGLNNGCDGTATAGSENSGDYIYINSYEISANPDKRLLSITIVGMNSEEGKAYVNSQENRVDSTIANANIFAMTGVMATDENSENYNTAINALLNTIGDASSLTYTEANFKNISKLTSLVNDAKSVNVAVEKENEVNAILTAWANCQSDLMLISPESSDIAFSDNVLSAVVTAANRKSDNAVSGVAIIALYDNATNKFLDMITADKSFEKNTQVEISGEFDIRNYEGVTSFGVKCFVWDTLTDIKALMNPVTLQ